VVSATRPLGVDAVASFARRRDGSVDVVLHLPGVPSFEGPTTLRLRNGDTTLRAPATTREVEDGVRVEASVPDRGLGDHVWQLALRTEDPRTVHRLQARLLAGRRRPVALLTGPRPTTVVPPPAPRRARAAAGRDGAGAPRGVRARRAAVTVVDTLLRPLPDARARRVRSGLAGVARRLPRTGRR
jgi:hypothetical protein